ncbi:MAG: hypothetical protein QXQ79_02780 [Candidatus Nanoarchaeia archaeon]
MSENTNPFLKHDAIFPYLEIDKLIITYYPYFDLTLENGNLTIGKIQQNKIKQIFEKTNINLKTLVERLKKNNVSDAFCIESELSQEEIQTLEDYKEEIVDYLANYSKYFGSKK